MGLKALIDRVQGILLKTEQEWEKIKGEAVTYQKLFIPYVAVLAAIPAVASYFGEIIFGGYQYIPFRGPVRHNVIGAAFFSMIYRYIIIFVVIFVLGLAINEFSTIFGSKRDKILSMKLSVYSFTPFCLIGVLFIFHFHLYWLVIFLSLYGLYIFYLGLGVLIETSNEKKVIFTVLTGIIYLISLNFFFLLGTLLSF